MRLLTTSTIEISNSTATTLQLHCNFGAWSDVVSERADCNLLDSNKNFQAVVAIMSMDTSHRKFAVCLLNKRQSCKPVSVS